MTLEPETHPSHPGTASSKRFDPWLIPLLACFVLAGLLGTRLIFDSDLGFHLKGGQWIAQNHQVPTQDTYTFTVSGHDYLDIHWLYQLMLYALFKLGGYSMISLANAGCALLLVFLTHKRLKLTDSPLWMRLVLLTTVLLMVEIRFRARPEILSYILMSLTLLILEMRTKGERNLLFLLPFLFVIWANVEGLFAVGWVIVGIYCLASLVQSKNTDQKLMLYSGMSLAAPLANPNFLKGAVYPFTQMLMLRNSNVFKQAIFELQPPWPLDSSFFLAPSLYLFVYKVFSLLLLLALVMTFRQRKIHEFLIFLVFFGLSLAALRNIILFMFVCGPLAVSCWKSLKWEKLRKAQVILFGHSAAPWLAALVLVGLCLRVATGAYYVNDRRPDRFGLGLDRDQVPVKACEFLAQNHLDGKILNQLNPGGWLEWLWSGKAFIDGRLEVMGEDFFRDFMSTSTPGRLGLLADKYQADILFFNPLDAMQWTEDLPKMPGWRPVYLDGNTVIYLRRGYGDQVPDLDYSRLPSDWGISKDIQDQALTILRVPSTPRWVSFWEEFFFTPPYPKWFQTMGVFNTFAGHPETAEAMDLEAIRLSRGRYVEFFYNLRGLFAASNRSEEEQLCDQQVKALRPGSLFLEYTGKASGN